jgi:hypothetical protein
VLFLRALRACEGRDVDFRSCGACLAVWGLSARSHDRLARANSTPQNRSSCPDGVWKFAPIRNPFGVMIGSDTSQIGKSHFIMCIR